MSKTMPVATKKSKAPRKVPESSAMVGALKCFGAALRERCSDGANFAAIEEEALSLANELTRRALQSELEAIVGALGTGDLLIDGVLHRHHHGGRKDYSCMVGTLDVERPTYRPVGVRNGKTVVPLEFSAGLIEGMTPAFAARVARGNGECTDRELHAQLTASRRVPPSRAKLERLCKRMGTALKDNVHTIESVARSADTLPAGTARVVIGLDRTTVPMEEARPADAPPKPPRVAPYVRKPPEPIEVHYRMAYIGTVVFYNDQGTALRSFRYAASMEDGPNEVLHSMMLDVRRAMQQAPTLHVLVIQDAAKEMWTLVIAALEKEPSVQTWDVLVDHYHAMEHLQKAAAIIDEPTDALMARWKTRLRESDDAIDEIEQRVLFEITQGYRPPLREELEKEAVYLANNKHRLRFAALRDAGCPIGSGPTEAACKSVVAQRAKRSGQRWLNHGLAAALASRTQLLNDRLPAAVVTLRERVYTRDVQLAA